MAFEVELKAHVLDKEEVFRRLSSLTGDMISERKEDIYYSLPGGPALFRIRFEQYGEDKGSLLFTYKEKTLQDGVEVNKEHEFTAFGDQLQAACDFVSSLGYVVFVTKKKVGTSFQLAWDDFPPLHVELVEVPPLGWFVEMEFLLEDKSLIPQAKEKLHAVLSRLGLSESAIEAGYYMDLLRAPAKQ